MKLREKSLQVPKVRTHKRKYEFFKNLKGSKKGVKEGGFRAQSWMEYCKYILKMCN